MHFWGVGLDVLLQNMSVITVFTLDETNHAKFNLTTSSRDLVDIELDSSW